MTNILQTLEAEQQEAIQILHRIWPSSSKSFLDSHAFNLRKWRHKLGRWPTADEIRAQWGA